MVQPAMCSPVRQPHAFEKVPESRIGANRIVARVDFRQTQQGALVRVGFFQSDEDAIPVAQSSVNGDAIERRDVRGGGDFGEAVESILSAGGIAGNGIDFTQGAPLHRIERARWQLVQQLYGVFKAADSE